MKTKKATKKLKKAHSALSAVASEWQEIGPGVRDLLASAAESISRALAQGAQALEARTPSSRPAKTAGTPRGGRGAAGRRARRRISAEGRSKLSLAAKRRWAAAKRRGAKSLAG